MREPAFWHRPPSWTSRLLMPLGALYGAVAGRRMQRPGFDAGVPVLCVGNYHTGGAGKTPTVLALTQLLRGIASCRIYRHGFNSQRCLAPHHLHRLAQGLPDESRA